MAPVPTIKKKQEQAQPTIINTADVYDEYGRSLDLRLRQQRRTDSAQQEGISANSQHAKKSVGDILKNRIVYRDVFPGRKYRVTLNDTSWMGEGNSVTIGYTVGYAFTEILVTEEAPEGNVFEFDLPLVPVIDTLQLRFAGTSKSVRGYLEDCTSSSSVIDVVDKIIDALSGDNGLEKKVSKLEDDIEALEKRVKDLEDKLPE